MASIRACFGDGWGSAALLRLASLGRSSAKGNGCRLGRRVFGSGRLVLACQRRAVVLGLFWPRPAPSAARVRRPVVGGPAPPGVPCPLGPQLLVEDVGVLGGGEDLAILSLQRRPHLVGRRGGLDPVAPVVGLRHPACVPGEGRTPFPALGIHIPEEGTRDPTEAAAIVGN